MESLYRSGSAWSWLVDRRRIPAGWSLLLLPDRAGAIRTGILLRIVPIGCCPTGPVSRNPALVGPDSHLPDRAGLICPGSDNPYVFCPSAGAIRTATLLRVVPTASAGPFRRDPHRNPTRGCYVNRLSGQACRKSTHLIGAGTCVFAGCTLFLDDIWICGKFVLYLLKN